MPLQITQPRQKQSFSQQLGNVANAYSQYSQEKELAMQQKAQQQAIAKQFPELAGMPPEMQKAAIPQLLKGRQGPTALQQTQEQLNRARIQQIEEQSQMFDKLRGQNPSQDQSAIGSGQSYSGVEGEQPQQNQKGGIETFPIETLKQLAAFKGQPGKQGVMGNMADTEINRREQEEKRKREDFQADRSYHSSYSKKAEEEVENIRSNLSKKQMSLALSRDAVESGEVGAFSLANLAQRLNIPEWQTMKGAQLETAIKENLLSNMSRVSAKGQNIWFEKRLNSMMAQIGKSKESNLAAQEILEGEVAMDESYVNNFDRLAKEDMDKYKFVKKDISQRAHSAAKYEEKQIFKRTSYRLKELEEQEKGLSQIKEKVGKNVEKGTPLTFAMAKLYKEKFKENALNVAEKNGYYIPTIEEYQMIRANPQEFREILSP